MSDDATSFSDDGAGDEKGVWAWLRERIFAPPHIPVQRLDALNQAIEADPEGAANYVVRGELWLQAGHYAEAAGDFDWALTLAARQFEEADWGLMSQALRDQAEIGLVEAQRKLKRKKV